VSSFNRPSPVILSSPCTVLPGSAASPNYADLSYPYRKAILIDEIRYDVYVVAPTVSPINLGAFLYVKHQLGQHYLMRDYVPLWLLGTMMVQQEEEANDLLLATQTTYSHYRWRLPEPLYIEAGQVLFSTFQRPQTPVIPQNMVVQVSYVGRVCPPNQPRPKSIIVPYAAPFVTTIGTTYQQSNEFHLFNPFDQPINVQRMTGRVVSTFDGSAMIAQRVLTPIPTAPTSAMTVLIDDSWGGKIVNNNTGPADVFDATRCAWTFDTVMPRKGQYNVRAWNIPVLQQLHIAMVGSRQEML
jgi:hypothetical protein